jgi:hypothetical protein
MLYKYIIHIIMKLIKLQLKLIIIIIESYINTLCYIILQRVNAQKFYCNR